ncbi:Protein of unknown function [Gryllus bimaculatus]|nr:Protein of unknown function [Gryllus bimaculatus]
MKATPTDDILQMVVGVVGEALELDVVGLRHEQRLEQRHQLAEGRALLRVLVPAVVHDVVELPAAVLGLVQAVAVAHAPHHLGRRQPRLSVATYALGGEEVHAARHLVSAGGEVARGERGAGAVQVAVATLGARAAQEALQLAQRHELHDHEQRCKYMSLD